MAKRSEFLSPEGFRLDGRRASEIRNLQCRLGGVLQADGSACVEMGNTKVLASVQGPHEAARRNVTAQDRAVITCEVCTMPYATGEHKSVAHGDRGATEIAAAVRRIFESVVQAQLYPRSQIDVSIVILQNDGGIRAAAVNATTLALIDAGIALEDFVCSCSAGLIHGTLLLDMNAQEDGAGAELCVGILPSIERVSYVQLESKVPLSATEEVVSYAMQGCTQVYSIMRDAVLGRTQEQLGTRGMLNG